MATSPIHDALLGAWNTEVTARTVLLNFAHLGNNCFANGVVFFTDLGNDATARGVAVETAIVNLGQPRPVLPPAIFANPTTALKVMQFGIGITHTAIAAYNKVKANAGGDQSLIDLADNGIAGAQKNLDDLTAALGALVNGQPSGGPFGQSCTYIVF